MTVLSSRLVLHTYSNDSDIHFFSFFLGSYKKKHYLCRDFSINKTIKRMKKLFLIAVMMVATLGASAQQMFIKPMVGADLTTWTGDVENTKMKVGLVAGAEFGYNLSEQFGLTAGLLYSMQGSKIKNVDKGYNMDYLNIPVLANYYIIPGLAIKAGIQPGFLMSAKHDGVDIKDFYKGFDLSVPLGLSYEISDFVIDARYNLGVSNIVDKDLSKAADDAKAHNAVIMLTVGYKIPF